MDYKHYGDARVATINALNDEVLRGVDPALVSANLQGETHYWLTRTPEGRNVDDETRFALYSILD
jgi:hypothetical protein